MRFPANACIEVTSQSQLGTFQGLVTVRLLLAVKGMAISQAPHLYRRFECLIGGISCMSAGGVRFV